MSRLRACLLLWAAASPVMADDVCQALREYDEIASTVGQRFYDKTFHGLDWTSRVAHHRKAIQCGDDERKVALRVNDLLSELRASHTAAYTKTDIDYWGLSSVFSSNLTDYQLDFSGIWPERRDGLWYAKYVLEDSPAALAGVLQGDQLLRLNGAPFSPLAFNGRPDSLVLSTDGKTSRSVSIRTEHESVMQAFIEASRASRRTFTIHGKQIAYFHLWTARDAILQSLEAALVEFETARVDALILDLRGGYGGTSPDYLSRLRASTHLMSIPKFFLIDDGVRSGKEMLAAIVKKEKLGTLVGSRTAGAFLGASPVRLFEDRYLVIIAAYSNALLNLPPIEGVGVQPDVAAPACRMRCGGHDPQLEKAFELISG